MADPTLTYRSGVTGQTVRAHLCRALTVFNPANAAFDTLTSGNWVSHLLTLTDPQAIGVYSIDLTTLNPALPAGPFTPCVYQSAAAGSAPVAGTGPLYWTGSAVGQPFYTANGVPMATPSTDAVTPLVIQPLPIGTLLTIVGGNGAYNLTQDGGIGAGGAAITLNGVALTTDSLRVLDVNNQPVANAAVQLFLATDTTFNAYAGTTFTGVDGRWVGPIKANSGSYTLLISAQGEQVDVVTGLVVP